MKAKVQNRSTKNDPVLEALPLACADEKAAVEFMEKQRWGGHPGCPRCGDMDVYQMKDSATGERQANYRWRCKGCKKQFTVRIGTVFEDSRIELRHWNYAFWRAATSKKGVAALELHRQTGLSYKSCLFMLNRIRFAMDGSMPGPMSGKIEADETYIGGKPREKIRTKEQRESWFARKPAVMAILERGGRVRTGIVADVTAKTLGDALRENVDPAKSTLYTDEFKSYRPVGKQFSGGHFRTKHSAGEYARGDAHSNTVEGFFSIVKRGLNGIYHAVSKEHLHRYLCEFEFRYNHRYIDDGERINAAIQASEGKRLTYEQSKASKEAYGTEA
jgi:transposase-like protein